MLWTIPDVNTDWDKSSLRAAEKDSRVLVDEELDLSQQCVLAAQKANHILGSIKSSVARRSKEVILLLYPHETPTGALHLQLWSRQPKKSIDLLE